MMLLLLYFIYSFSIPGTDAANKWTEWGIWGDCFVADCQSGIHYRESTILKPKMDKSPYPDTDIVCVRREYKNIRFHTFENSYGLAKQMPTQCYRSRSCEESNKFSISNFLPNEKCRLGTIDVQCNKCFSNNLPSLLNATTRLPTCPQSTWLYKLVGGIFAVFIMIGFLLILFRLLQSLECLQFNRRMAPRRSAASSNRNSVNNDAVLQDALILGMPLEDKLPDYNQVIENPNKYALGPTSQGEQLPEIGFRVDGLGTPTTGTLGPPPAYGEALSFIDSTPVVTPRAQP